MFRFLILMLISYFLPIFQSAVISEIFPGFLKPDLMLIFITYLGASLSLIAGAILVFSCGLFYDTFSGSPLGLFLLIYLGIFFLIKLLGKVLIIGETVAARMGLVALAVAFQLFLLILLPPTLGIMENFSLPALSWILPQAMITCAACWPLFGLFKKITALPGLKPLPPVD